MKKSISLLAVLIAIIGLTSCKKEKEKDKGTPTIIKGNVYDSTRGINIPGYKIYLGKSWQVCANWECWDEMEDVDSATTNTNGDYTISFNYKLKPNERYFLIEHNYAYYHESTSGGRIVPGITNTINMSVWKPVELIVNIEVLNNNIELRIACRFDNDKTLNATEYIYEKNAKKTYTLRAPPNSDVSMHFWYYVWHYNGAIIDGMEVHDKVVPLRTTLSDVTTLNFVVDCSTF
jgi:hypothetical protein